MAILSILSFLLLFCSFSCAEVPQVYIVYTKEQSGEKALHEIEETHHSYLMKVKDTEEDAKKSLIYSYKHSCNGFAALLSPSQASKLSEMEEVVKVIPSNPKKYTMHTTRSWDFVGLEEKSIDPRWASKDLKERPDLLSKANYGKGIIVGLIDSGIWPESKSFSDEGMGPVPKSWKGICQTGQAFDSSHCNRKVIGARYYLEAYEKHYGPLDTTLDYRSPRDKDGHGTHTASTVGGMVVRNASYMGSLAAGFASGGAPLVHLAIYKACWAVPNQDKSNGNVCFEPDMLAAIDDAIRDGVDVLSISIGTTEPHPFDEDGIATGALHAVKKNIVVAASAGNWGPTPGSLCNTAPWIITVGASTVDRTFVASVMLGDGTQMQGGSTGVFEFDNKMYPLVYAGDVGLPDVDQSTVGHCLPNTLSPEKAKGKIILCLRGGGSRLSKGFEVKRAGGAGIILGNPANYGAMLVTDPFPVPGISVGYEQVIEILKYMGSTQNATAKIYPPKTELREIAAPSMASFTSRGPNVLDPNILKPDITAPGVDILAAWTGEDAPTKRADDDRRVEWNIFSGTSMSCPHVAAAAALLKAIHPTWSSAAIRSALITTAEVKDNKNTTITDIYGDPADPFQYGAGHFNPINAADPGLVYDASYSDYHSYLSILSLSNSSTSNFNYPSLSISNFTGSTVTVTRTVTNVGANNSVYHAVTEAPKGYKMKISPRVLRFSGVGEKKSFRVTVKRERKEEREREYGFGWWSWGDGVHTVRSPIVVSSN